MSEFCPHVEAVKTIFFLFIRFYLYYSNKLMYITLYYFLTGSDLLAEYFTHFTQRHTTLISNIYLMLIISCRPSTFLIFYRTLNALPLLSVLSGPIIPNSGICRVLGKVYENFPQYIYWGHYILGQYIYLGRGIPNSSLSFRGLLAAEVRS